jgi:D-3-phosphoglycerate dehydrogenase/C-terminal binding protein
MSKFSILIAEGKRQSLYTDKLDYINHSMGDILDDRFSCAPLKALSEDDINGMADDADALIVSPGMTIGEKTIHSLKKCRCIVSLAVGYDHIDIMRAGEHGIPVCNVPDYGTEEVADSTMAFILCLARKTDFFNHRVRSGDAGWNWRLGIPAKRIRGSVLGIIGLGRIGIATAIRAKAFGFRVCFHDPYVPEGIGKALGIEMIGERSELLTISDIVSIHTPLTEITHGMINMEFFSAMKRNAILVNTARGQLFDSLNTIERALREGLVAAIGTDVLPQEPPDIDHPLIRSWRADAGWISGRLLVSPHAAFYAEESLHDLCAKALATARNAVLGQTIRNIVNQNFIKEV